MKEQFNYLHHSIAFERIGNGSNYIIALHGVKQQSAEFRFLEHQLDAFTIIALDLPYHGFSQWQESRHSNQDAVGLFEAIMQQLGCTKVHVMAYSIGARMALSVLQEKPQWVASLVLIAPDGIKENKWYRFATRSPVGKPLFKLGLKYPMLLHKLFDMAVYFKYIKKSYAAFYKNSIATKEEARHLYQIWMGFSDLNIDLDKAISEMNQHKISCLLIVGKYDKLVPESSVSELVSQASYLHYVVVEKSHDLLQSITVAPIQQHFKAYE